MTAGMIGASNSVATSPENLISPKFIELVNSIKKSNLEKTLDLTNESSIFSYENMLFGDTLSDSVRQSKLISRNKIDSIINDYYQKNPVPREITKQYIGNILNQESSRQIYAYNRRSGARGLGQFLKETWNEVDPEVPYEVGCYNPIRSVQNTIKYYTDLSHLNKSHNPFWDALSIEEKQRYLGASYNWGFGKLQRVNFDLEHKSVPKETQDYIGTLPSVQ